jgi:AcrR family transcriptional regulator
VPVEPPIRTLPTLGKTVDKMADPRYRRTRAQICAAMRRLLESGETSRLTFAMVAEAAEVNRSTVHQHYASRHELVADALAGDLAAIAEPLARCPFKRSRATPPELVEMFSTARTQGAVLDRLDGIEFCLVGDRLTELLTVQLAARFADGARPPGFDRVRPEIHARFVAAGLVGLLFAPEAGDPATSAKQAWQLIAPVPA